MATETEGPIPKKRRKKDEAIAEYRERTKTLRSVARNSDPKEVLLLVAKDLKKSKELFPLVNRKLDGAAADARHAKEVATLGKQTANYINVTQRNIELKRLILHFKREIESDMGGADGQQMEEYFADNFVESYLRRTSAYEFFYGVLREQDLEPKKRKPRIRREPEVVTQTTTAKEKDVEIDVELDQTPKEVEHINKHIRRISISKKKEAVPFFATVVDPNSFVRTIENIFHTSFLVKEGKIGVKPDDDRKIPILTVEEDQTQETRRRQNGDQQEAPVLHGNQSILSFSVNDYRNWISQYNITKCALPIRVETGVDDDDTEIEVDDEETDIDI